MGAAASSLKGEIPDRVDIHTMERFMEKYGIKNVEIDKVRFSLLKDGNDTVSRSEALHLIENKLPPIFSVNALL